MTTGQPDYASVIADLKRRRDELTATIDALEAVAGDLSVAMQETEVRSDTFFGMTILDAIVQYLGMVRKPQTPTQIAAALEAGGIVSESSNFPNTVATTMRREQQKNGAILRLPERKWGLAERYPQAARRRAARQDGGNNDAANAAEAATPAADDSPTEPEQPSDQPPNAAPA